MEVTSGNLATKFSLDTLRTVLYAVYDAEYEITRYFYIIDAILSQQVEMFTSTYRKGCVLFTDVW